VPLLGEKDFERIREIVREEVQAALKGEATGSFTLPDDEQPCPATKDHLVCVKTAHKGRHTFRPRPHEAPPSKWTTIPDVIVHGTGSRKYLMRPGSPCKVKGLGKGGGAQPGWHITKIEQSTVDPTDINVTVDRRGSHTRTVKIEKIVYARPK
jgi:hypothetical protein